MMSKRNDDIDAVVKSYALWAKKLDQKDRTSLGADGCPLCSLYFNGSQSECCIRCPVAIKTGARYCSKTPYGSASDAVGYIRDAHYEFPDFRLNEGLVRTIAKEMRFLEDLLVWVSKQDEDAYENMQYGKKK